MWTYHVRRETAVLDMLEQIMPVLLHRRLRSRSQVMSRSVAVLILTIQS